MLPPPSSNVAKTQPRKDTIHPFRITGTKEHTILFSNDSAYDEIASKATMSQYYLLTPNVWAKKILPTSLLLVLLRLLFQKNHALSNLTLYPSMPCHSNVSSSLRSVVKYLILPSLASSCCLVQVIINFITGIGCIGFNSILGPMRPWAVSLQLFLTIQSIGMGEFNPLPLSMTWFLTFTPEIVALINHRRYLVSHEQFVEIMGKTEVEPIVVDLIVENMGCVACINKIESSMENSFPKKLMRVESWLHHVKKGGQVRLFINASNEESKGITKQAISLIQKAGFDCRSKE